MHAVKMIDFIFFILLRYLVRDNLLFINEILFRLGLLLTRIGNYFVRFLGFPKKYIEHLCLHTTIKNAPTPN